MDNKRWALGLTLLGVVVVLWVASGFFVNAIGASYDKPCFITYLNTGLMALYLPGALLTKRRNADKLSLRYTAGLSLQFCLLWFSSNLLNNASYIYTTVQSATIIACTSSFFTLLIGTWFGVEKFDFAKVWPLLASLVGVVLITNEDGQVESASNPVLGNLLALGSALLYGVYTTMLKYRVGDESKLDTKMFFGFVGVFNIIGLWPLLVVLDRTGVEKFAWPQAGHVWLLLGLNGVAIFISDFCWVLAMLLTSPLVVTVGLSATIPLSMLGEILFYGRVGSFTYFAGAALVFWSFLVINRQEETDAEDEAELPSRGYTPIEA